MRPRFVDPAFEPQRTARAEATLVRTEQQIHYLADEVRRDLKKSSRKG